MYERKDERMASLSLVKWSQNFDFDVRSPFSGSPKTLRFCTGCVEYSTFHIPQSLRFGTGCVEYSTFDIPIKMSVSDS